MAGDGSSTIPYIDAAAQDALYNSSAKGAHSGSRDSVLDYVGSRDAADLYSPVTQ